MSLLREQLINLNIKKSKITNKIDVKKEVKKNRKNKEFTHHFLRGIFYVVFDD